jgi:hypothetical protein
MAAFLGASPQTLKVEFDVDIPFEFVFLDVSRRVRWRTPGLAARALFGNECHGLLSPFTLERDR